MDKKNIIIFCLAIALILVVGYILYGKLSEDSFNSGFQFGFNQAILEVMQQTSTCQQVPLQNGDSSINIIAVECLKVKE